MEKLSVLIFVESRYKVSRKRIKQIIKNTLDKNGINGAVEVSVAIVGDRKMRELSKNIKERIKPEIFCHFRKPKEKNCRCRAIPYGLAI